MFNRWFRARKRSESSCSTAPHPADKLLKQGLLQIPTPLPGADFDSNVLRALQRSASAKKQPRQQSWTLPAVATVGLAAMVVLPSTQAVLRTETVSIAHYAGVREMVPFDLSPTPELAPEQQWVTVLPPLLIYRDYAKQYVNAAREATPLQYLDAGRNDDAIRCQDSVDGQDAEALGSVCDQWQHNPVFLAALLRHRLARTNVLGDFKATDHPGLENLVPQRPKPSGWYMPAATDDVVQAATLGMRQNPDNAFFAVANAALAFAKGQDADGVAMVKKLPQTKFWYDYGAEEITARYLWERRVDSKSAFVAAQTLWPVGYESFPANAVIGVSVRAHLYAAKQERAGNTAKGIAIRLALCDVAAKISAQSRDLTDQSFAERVMAIATDVPLTRNWSVPYHPSMQEAKLDWNARER